MRAALHDDVVACIPHLRRYARGLLHDRDKADDLVQDTLERAWDRLPLWQRRGDLRAWMFGIMHNLFIDGARSARHGVEQSTEELPDVADPAAPTDRLAVLDVERALQRLPVEQREVLLLVGVEELSYQEVAEVLRVPIGTVMSRLSRARERLRAELEGRAAPARLQRVK